MSPVESRSSMLPDLEEQALRRAISAIHEAKNWLAVWCPHGGDSSRTRDYYAADKARDALDDALVELEASV